MLFVHRKCDPLEEAKRNLVKDVNRFGRLRIKIVSSPNGGMVVHHNSESSLVVEVKSKQHLDPLLIGLKESILGKMKK